MSQPRRFDHDEARRLYAGGHGVSRAELAARFGVTYKAVYLVTGGKHYKSPTYQRDRFRRPCVDGCGRLAWHGPKQGTSGRCVKCAAARQTESVRPTSLRCGKCREWKPDEAFAHNAAPKHQHRRGRNNWCKDCDAARQRAQRAANREEYNRRERERRRRRKAAA